MVTVLHGEDRIASREELIKLRQRYRPEAIFDFREGGADEFIAAADGSGLFSDRKLIVVEVYKPALVRSLPYLSYLEKKPEKTEVVIWIAGQLTASSELVKLVRKNHGRVAEFNEFNRKAVFVFLDALFSRNLSGALNGLNALLDSEENLFGVLSLIVSRTRLILRSKLGSTGAINSWWKEKTAKEAANLSLVETANFFRACLATDLEMKTGRIEPSLGLIGLLEILC